MRGQDESSLTTPLSTPDGLTNEESKRRYLTYAKALGNEPNQEQARYFLYGDAPEETWETPEPEWILDLPETAPLTKQEQAFLSSGM